jgi:hypothetical protein
VTVTDPYGIIGNPGPSEATPSRRLLRRLPRRYSEERLEDSLRSGALIPIAHVSDAVMATRAHVHTSPAQLRRLWRLGEISAATVLGTDSRPHELREQNINDNHGVLPSSALVRALRYTGIVFERPDGSCIAVSESDAVTGKGSNVVVREFRHSPDRNELWSTGRQVARNPLLFLDEVDRSELTIRCVIENPRHAHAIRFDMSARTLYVAETVDGSAGLAHRNAGLLAELLSRLPDDIERAPVGVVLRDPEVTPTNAVSVVVRHSEEGAVLRHFECNGNEATAVPRGRATTGERSLSQINATTFGEVLASGTTLGFVRRANEIDRMTFAEPVDATLATPPEGPLPEVSGTVAERHRARVRGQETIATAENHVGHVFLETRTGRFVVVNSTGTAKSKGGVEGSPIVVLKYLTPSSSVGEPLVSPEKTLASGKTQRRPGPRKPSTAMFVDEMNSGDLILVGASDDVDVTAVRFDQPVSELARRASYGNPESLHTWNSTREEIVEMNRLARQAKAAGAER